MILIERCLRRSRLAEELVEEWQIEHDNGEGVSDLEEVASECLQVANLARHVWDLISDGLFEARIDDIETVGNKLNLVFQKTLRVIRQVNDAVNDARSKGHAIHSAADLSSRLQDIENVMADFTKTWPKANPKLAAESLAAYHIGEFNTAEELLSAQSCGAQAD